MSHIHTLADLSGSKGAPSAAAVNREALPNPWATPGRTLGTGRVARAPAQSSAPPAPPAQRGEYAAVPQYGYAPPYGYGMQQQQALPRGAGLGLMDPATPPNGITDPVMAGGTCGDCSCCIRPGACTAPLQKAAARRYFLTFVFIVTCVEFVVFIAELSIAGFASPAVNRMLGPPQFVFLLMGAKVVSTFFNPTYEIWRLVTSMFLHAGIIHIGMNAYTQLRFGVPLENRFGHWRIAVLYLFSGLAGNLLSSVAAPTITSLGASGAGFGLFGMYAAFLALNFRRLSKRERCCGGIFLLMSMPMFLIISFVVPFVDGFAHLGGFIAGFFIALFMVREDLPRRDMRKPWFVLFVAAGLVLVALYLVLPVLLFTVIREQLGF